MLMPRAHEYNNTITATTTTTNNNNCKAATMNISVSMRHQHQQHHVNQLLTTAAAGTGVVGDVDALLMPLQVTSPVVESAVATQRFEARPERNLWRTDEIIQMLNILQTTNAIEMLNDKTVKSEKVFRNVEEIMHQCGYRKKSHVQIWTKWKFLKSTYTTSKRNGVMPKMIPLEIFEILHKILEGGTSDCGNSTASLDGNESSNGAGGGGNLVISGVEGGFYSGKKGNKVKADSEEENGFGMAHPIFGFRLGMVKQEPVDIGYENVAHHNGNVNGHKRPSDNDDPLDEHTANSTGSTSADIHFQAEIKQEIEEERSDSPQTMTPPPPPSPPLPSVEKLKKINRSEIMINKRPVRITALPIATSTPTATTQVPPTAARNPTQLPPLRIAPFAKVPNNTANAMQPLDRPPPPLSMHLTPRPVRLTSSQNKPVFIQPKPVPIHNLPPPPMRMPKGLSVQTRSAGASNAPRLKQLPMRKKQYYLMPERIIPHHDELPSPPDSFAPPHHYSVDQEGPSTSQHAQMLTTKRRMPPLTQPKKKNRRLQVPWNEANNGPNTVPMAKMPRVYSNASISPVGYSNGRGNYDDDEVDEDNSMFDSSASMQRESFKAAQEAQAGHQRPFRPSRKEQEYFESALKDLGNSLRQTQKELISDFFANQMELAQQEHEFQMQQDALIMEAFEEQSRSIMRTAKELLGLDFGNLSPMKEGSEEKIVKNAEVRKELHKIEKETEGRKTLEAKDLVKEAALETMTEDHNEDEEEDDSDDDEDDNECEGENEDEDGEACQMEEDEDNDEQLEYEDGLYMQDHNAQVEGVSGETAEDDNDESSSSSEEDEDDDDNDEDENENEEDENENENDEDNDEVDDPTQMLSSELVEDN